MDLGVIKFCPKLSRIMLWFFNSVWILPFCMGAVISVEEIQPTVRINWYQRNPIFKDGANMTISLDTNLIVKCPTTEEYYRVYWVSKREFEHCALGPKSDATILVNCNNPRYNISFTKLITEFSGVPGKRNDFALGQTYYIATFSTGTEEGLVNEDKGACFYHNMKVQFTVTEPPAPPTLPPTNNTGITTMTPKPTPHPTQPTTKRPTTITTTERTTSRRTTPRRTTQRPRPTDIPNPTDIVISVPDNGNTATIVADSAPSLTHSWALGLCLCLSFLHILNNAHIPWTLR